MKDAAMDLVAVLSLPCEQFFEEVICLLPKDVISLGSYFFVRFHHQQWRLLRKQ